MNGTLDCQNLFTREIITALFSKIFNSSIILNSKLEIVSVNDRALEFLANDPKSLIGKSIDCLRGEEGFVEEISDLLSKGFFTDHECSITGRDAQKLIVRISGFHLGIISDFNQLIVLSINNVSSEYKLVSRLRSWEITMDELAYKAAHDLRGPIASILGLVNVAKNRSDNQEVDLIFDHIKNCGETLDQRLRECVDNVVVKLETDI